MTGLYPSYQDAQTEFSFWCLFAAPLIVATDIRYMGDKVELLNSEAIAVNQDPLTIAGDLRGNFTDGGQIWSRPLSGGRWAVILYNSNIVVEWAEVVFEFSSTNMPGWPQGETSASLRDLWAHKELGTFQDQFSSGYLGAHESVFLLVTPSSSLEWRK
jgi:alpha-galactosidase